MPSHLLDWFAVTAPGLEPVLAEELAGLGAGGIAIGDPGGVAARSDLAGLYLVHLHARVPVRVWVRLGAARARTLDNLAAAIRAMPWASYLHPRAPITVRVSTSGSRLQARSGVGKKVELAIRDALRVPRGDPGRPPSTPAEILVRITGDTVEASIDASGELLHRRGWRRNTSEAPIRENLAAAILHLSEWGVDEPLVDPMCGSGTFAIEAATIALGLPPGAGRGFAFERWPCFDRATWDAVRAELPAARGRAIPPIAAFDRDPRAIEAAVANARRAGVADRIAIGHADVADLTLGQRPGLVVANPPYGARLRDATPAWAALGGALRARGLGWRVALVVPVVHRRELLRATGLDLDEVARFDNGGLPVALHVGAVRARDRGVGSASADRIDTRG